MGNYSAAQSWAVIGGMNGESDRWTQSCLQVGSYEGSDTPTVPEL